MAHVAKFTRGAMGHMLSHYDRSKTPGDNIDTSRTALNYNLAAEQQPLSQLDFIHQRLQNVKLQNRKDVKVLCDWVVTAPKDLPQELQPQFFKETYEYLASKYGKNNVISAYVHNDEVTPHLHFAFIPVVEDRKKGGLKVSAKECITRSDLQHFHEDLQHYLESKLQQPVNILNEATKNGNKSIAELKRGTAQQELEKLQSEISELNKSVNMTKDQLLQVKAMGNIIVRNDLLPDLKREVTKLKSAQIEHKKGVQI